jgi:hypothetical protein
MIWNVAFGNHKVCHLCALTVAWLEEKWLKNSQRQQHGVMKT